MFLEILLGVAGKYSGNGGCPRGGLLYIYLERVIFDEEMRQAFEAQENDIL